jgi:putative Flp pilus-assembly TadE/G-like protein
MPPFHNSLEASSFGGACRRQRGAVVPLVVIALLALVGITALALDGAHVVLNKARLQSALDAAALSAAKVLDQTNSTAQATTAANSVFSLNATPYPELTRAVGNGLTLTTEYSSTLIPFTAGTVPAKFVRTKITGFSTVMSLASVLGVASINVGGSAVAGPSPTLNNVCDIVPIMLCADASKPSPLFGYQTDQILGLKKVPSSNAQATDLGPGNYNLLSIGGNGASLVRSNFAGSYAGCATQGQPVITEPGVAAGPVAQGINTRFNDFSAVMGGTQAQYPPDVIGCPNAASCTNSDTQLTWKSCNGNQSGCTESVQQGNGANAITVTTASQISPSAANFQGYTARVKAGNYDTPPPTGHFQRRVVAVPIGDCSTAVNGKGSVNVLGFACVFFLQPVQQSTGQIFAQIASTCDAQGQVGPGAGTGPLPHKIQLYKSAGSPDS